MGNEKQMRHFPFERNFPSISYIANNWPKTKNVLRKYVMSKQKKPDLFILCQRCLNNFNIRKPGNFNFIIKKLSKICSKNFYYNTYHDQHHFKSVILISCLLAKLNNLKNKKELILLIIIALTHDLGHQGRRIINKPYYQEEKSFKDLKKILFGQILNLKKIQKIEKIFRNTFFPIKPENVDDLIEKIILDADILASLMFGLEDGMEFAKRLKHEIRFEDKSDKLFSGFLKLLDGKSLYLKSSKNSC